MNNNSGCIFLDDGNIKFLKRIHPDISNSQWSIKQMDIVNIWFHLACVKCGTSGLWRLCFVNQIKNLEYGFFFSGHENLHMRQKTQSEINVDLSHHLLPWDTTDWAELNTSHCHNQAYISSLKRPHIFCT